MTVHEITKEKFEQQITKERECIIKFTASWCSPCKYLAPIFEELSEEIKIPCYEVDVDKEPQLAQQFNILSVPTTVLLKNGKEVVRINGALRKQQLKERLTTRVS